MSTQFHSLRVVDIAEETSDAIALTLKPDAEHDKDFVFKPGQHLTLRAMIDGEDVRRNYSLFVSPQERLLRVAIKRVTGGVFSNWAANDLKPGDRIDVMTPRGHFTWDFEQGQRRNYVAFAAGSGITPVLSLLKTGLLVEPESQFILLYGNRTTNSVMFLEDIAALKDRYLDRFQVYHFLDGEADEIELFNGRLDQERVATVLETVVDPASVDAAFICGPGLMMDAAEAALIEAGVNPDIILVERFSVGRPAGADAAAAMEATREAEGLTLQVAIDGRRRVVPFDVAAGNILDSARAAGLSAPYACKAGVCATCRAKLVSGEVKMLANYGLSKEEVAAGYILTCQSVPVGEGVVVDYDA
ncbi:MULTISPECIES: 2Fe-2S iron-sulfur cluster-binding protein [unclassified Sphingobium]|nr:MULTISPECIES: 2Fe-2S iron-sulfur cluster-binding protein [unclassified Sphingobium]TWD21025.1 ring-1,2-phenylacetyl-CoA epoxidase subunit PaaE [Sphingobium sp. AEW001]MBG6120426.1 ring-1,2-phenylacetyl-CoA epoxidase subunit PaaE [Sphingobium sp. JAI105]PSO10025.1 phenylacetate-CoA oxygenase [Sphingobium sp. AEW4]TWC98918.1 ring-1,2-phenylacetyl-CoA epoxidase subunit PaaE [Sphingobium sp. AEW010]TWD18397.1 ring-1,2-phenylacetyl-CoA epoxidase subunit PaaE [Sphingobium sp. AEW013]